MSTTFNKCHLEVVKLLLDNCVDIDAKIDINGWTALHEACNKGHTKVGKLLLEKGADVDGKRKHGMTPYALDM